MGNYLYYVCQLGLSQLVAMAYVESISGEDLCAAERTDLRKKGPEGVSVFT